MKKTNKTEKKLDSFIKKISKNKMCKFWNGKEDLAGKVSRAMSSMIKRHPAVGWVRGNYVLNDDMMIKMQNLYAENILYKEKEQLENKKNLYKKGKDVTNVVFNILEKDFYLNILRREIIEFSWDELFKVWGQVFLEENRSYNLKSRIANNAIENGMITTGDTEEAMLSDESFEKVSVQFMALGLLEVVHPNHDNDYDMSQESRFRVTKAGEKYLIDLLAEKNNTYSDEGELVKRDKDEFIACRCNFQGKSGYMVKQYKNNVIICDQFVEEDSFEKFQKDLGLEEVNIEFES